MKCKKCGKNEVGISTEIPMPEVIREGPYLGGKILIGVRKCACRGLTVKTRALTGYEAEMNKGEVGRPHKDL